MKILFHIIRPPAEAGARLWAAHHIWLAVSLTGLGCCVGLLSLIFSSYVYRPMLTPLLQEAYFHDPLLLAMNCLAPVLLIWLFYFLSGRAWVGYLGCAVPMGTLMAANYFKIRLRTDPVLATDLRLISEAWNTVGGYDLALGKLLPAALACLAAGLVFSIVMMPRGIRSRRPRLFGAASCLALIAVALAGPYSSEDIYQRINHNDIVNAWSDTQLYLSKGCIYSFLHSGKELFPTPPEGYRRAQAARMLAEYPDSDIPEGKKVSIMGFMLEGFCDLTDFEFLAGQESVAQLYAPWHALEEQSVSGNLLTNIFGGGTVETERGFLTGYSVHDNFRGPTESYVWYLRDQGYQTFGSHPGQEWFYNRQNVNRYLGFQEYRFMERYFSSYCTMEEAREDSDALLAAKDLERLRERIADGPCFSFSVTYQNHGPYDPAFSGGEFRLTPEGCGASEETCRLLNDYMDGISRTIRAFTELTLELEDMDEPVVLVLFGDHKPALGESGIAYYWMGIDFDLSTTQGFYNYYSTPYLIWANSSAKAVLGQDFTGAGGDFSPCFLMPKVFDLCGWDGPGFMKLAREMRAVTPVLHALELFWADGGFTDTLDQEDMEFYQRYLCMQYYRERSGR